MTPVYEYAIAVGHDQTALTNVEDIISYAPVGKPVPLGSVRRKTLDRRVQTNGNKIVTWSFKAMSFDDFETLISLIFGDLYTENANVTIDTRERTEVFSRFNAIAHLPLEGEDYQRREYGSVEDLVITFDDLQEITGGSGFSIGFSFGFEA